MPSPFAAPAAIGHEKGRRVERRPFSFCDRTGQPHSRDEGAKSLKCGGRSDRGQNMRLRLMIVNIRHPLLRPQIPAFRPIPQAHVRERTLQEASAESLGKFLQDASCLKL